VIETGDPHAPSVLDRHDRVKDEFPIRAIGMSNAAVSPSQPMLELDSAMLSARGVQGCAAGSQDGGEPMVSGNDFGSAPRRWQVLIVEDDPVIASIYRKTIGGISRLEVAGIVRRGEDALAFVARRPCDLVLLDLSLAGMDGLAMLQQLRQSGHHAEVIALTADSRTHVVRAVIQGGAVDYLVKPFSPDRLRQALGLFLNRAAALNGERLDQDAIDRVCSGGRVAKRWLPKGLTEDGMDRVRASLGSCGAGASSSDVADAIGMARVTARRYLEYLVATGQASVDAIPTGPGRPRKLYQLLT
jgi:response regulator of citrate/malate metabolism